MSIYSHNIAVFESTLKMCRTDAGLRGSVESSIAGQRVVLADDDLPEHEKIRKYDMKIVVSRLRSFEAAAQYIGCRTAVLNFADQCQPGGLVEHGETTQEEALCRVSTLFPCISCSDAVRRFYTRHIMRRDELGTDDLIYTPGVTVFREDPYPNGMLERRFSVDVITCSAPVTWNPVTDETLYGIQKKRFGRIIETAYSMGATHLILGAFGCGAFCNDPDVVSAAAKAALEEWDGCFDTVEFPVYCAEDETRNYTAFRDAFRDQRCLAITADTDTANADRRNADTQTSMSEGNTASSSFSANPYAQYADSVSNDRHPSE